MTYDGEEHERLGPYRLLERLGEGGMGVVHLALDRRGRAVALKELHPHVAADHQARARLAREVDVLSLVNSPRVAPILDADVSGPRPYVVTAWITGPTLESVVPEQGPLTGEALHDLGAGLAEALTAIHEAGVVHRDVKPGNVLLSDAGPVLIDFGIAHVIDQTRFTVAGLVMGTPGYLAPEIVEGAPVSDATDWWGWAATLAYAASGRQPFGRGGMEAVLGRVARGDADLTGVDPRISPLLAAALSPRPELRPHRDEVVEALARYARGGDVTEVLRVHEPAPVTEMVPVARTRVMPLAPAAPAPAPAAPAPAPAAPAAPAVPPATLAPPARPPAPPQPSPAVPVGFHDRPPAAAPAPFPAGPQPAAYTPVPQPQRPLPTPYGTGQPGTGPDGQWIDPRAARPRRTGSALLLLVAVAALGAFAPVLAGLALLLGTVLARTLDGAVTSYVLKRHERGAKASDVPLAVAATPIHLVTGTFSAIASLLLPAVVGVSAAFVGAMAWSAYRGGAIDPTGFAALGFAYAVAATTLWWGPGGAGTRRGTRSLLRGVAPGPVGGAVVAALALAALVLLVHTVLTGGTPTWWPLTSGPGSLLGPLGTL